MTIRAITDADLPAIVAVWEAQRAVLGHLSPNMPYETWDVARASGFLRLSTVARMDDATNTFCVLTLNPETDKYEVVPGISNMPAFERCFKACVAVLPPGARVYGSSPKGGPAFVRNRLNSLFLSTQKGDVIEWEASREDVEKQVQGEDVQSQVQG